MTTRKTCARVDPIEQEIELVLNPGTFIPYGKTAPDAVMSIEERTRLEQERKDARRAAKQQRVTETT